MPNKQILVNVTTRVVNSAIRRETRHGREVIIVPSATMPDNVIMNRVRYPAERIANSFKSLDKTFAPFGHPKIDSKHISARDPVAVNMFHVGAHNENVRRENGRVLLDKVIDVTVANQSENGRKLLAAINAGEPIHTSTGIFLERIAVNATDHDFDAGEMVFDHDAILINEEGAATPAQGVGMMVNSAGTEEQVDVINCTLNANAQEDGLLQRFMNVLASAFERGKPQTLTTNSNEAADMTPEQLKALQDSFTANNATLATQIGTAVSAAVTAALKPLSDTMGAMQANMKAAEDKERGGYVDRIVKANLLSKEIAETMATNALRELATKAAPGTADVINGAPLDGNAVDEFKGFDMNANIKAAMGTK